MSQKGSTAISRKPARMVGRPNDRMTTRATRLRPTMNTPVTRIASSDISSEPSADVALLELESIPSKPIVSPLGDSDAVEVGDEIFIVGAPFGISHTLILKVMGIQLSAENRPKIRARIRGP